MRRCWPKKSFKCNLNEEQKSKALKKAIHEKGGRRKVFVFIFVKTRLKFEKEYLLTKYGLEFHANHSIHIIQEDNTKQISIEKANSEILFPLLALVIYVL